MSVASSSSDRQNPPAQPRRSRLLLKLSLGVLLVLVLLVAAAPTLLSSGPGRNLILGMANERVAGTVAIDDLSLRWFGPQRIAGLRLADPAGDPVVTVAEFKTGLSLFQALRGRLGLGETLIRGLRVELALDPSGQDNLEAAIGLAQEPGAPSGPLLIPVTGDLVLEQGYLSWSAPGIEAVIIEDLAARVRLDPSSRDLALDLSARSRQGDMSGSLAVSGTLRQWLDARGRLTLASVDPDLQVRIEALPLRLVDKLAGLDGLLVAALGQQLSVRLASSERQLDLKVESPRLAVDLAADLRDLRFALTRPAALRWTLTPELVAELTAGAGGDDPLRLQQAVDLQLALESLNLPLAGFDPAVVALRGRLDSSAPLRLSGGGLGSIQLQDPVAEVASDGLAQAITVRAGVGIHSDGRVGQLRLDGAVRELFDSQGRLQADRLQVEATAVLSDLPTLLLDRIAGADGLLVAGIGPRLSLTAEATTREDARVDVAVELHSEHLRTQGLRLRLDDAVALTGPGRVSYRLTPALVARLAPENPFQLRTPADLELLLTAFSAPRPRAGEALLQPQRTRLEASFHSKALELVDREGLRSRLADLRLDLGGASLAALTLEGSGRLSQTAPGPLALMEASPLALDLNLRSGLGPQGRIEPLEGRIELRGGALEATLPFQVSAGLETLALTAPAQVSVPLTPALLARWLDAETPASGQIRLAEAAPLRLVLERLEAGLADPGLSALQFDGSAAIGRMRFRSGNQVLAALDQLDVGLQWQGSQGRGGVSVDGRVSADGGEPGVINGSLALDSLRPDGSGNLNLDLDLTQLPLVVVDRFLGMDGMVTATLGRTMEGTLQGELREGQGPLTLGIRGSNASADLKAHWNQGSLTLREPLMAEVQPTPEFGRLVLARVHPLFETLRGGKEPFRFVMPAEGVLIPLIDYDLKNVRVPEMRLSLGRVELASGWLLQGLVTLGQRFGTLRSAGDRWPAEFTPAVVSVADGQLTFTRRMDVLLGDQMHLATWGAMDLVTQRADLVLGVMPLTLRSVFSVAAAEDDALRIAVRGQAGPGAVDFSRIGIELARLQAQRRLGGSSPLLGALLGTVTGSTPGLSGAPAPSMSPLPWAERLK